MRRGVRLAVGLAVGGGALGGYLLLVGPVAVGQRAAAIAPGALALVACLVVLEGLADGVGVWASLRPLGRGAPPGLSVQFALAGDFFDLLGPAGPVTSEPVMARFMGVATGTTYGEALGVRSVAKYVKAAVQVAVAAAVGVGVALDGGGRFVLAVLAAAGVVLAVVGVVALRARDRLSAAMTAVLAPVVARVSALYRAEPYDRAAVAAALERFWARVVGFRERPGLLVLIGLAGLLEQLLVAGALWAALGGTGVGVAFLPLVVVVPLPRAASVAPIPASLGAYDLLLSGALVLGVGAPAAAAAAAVLVVRTVSVPFGLAAGGLSVAFLRGWRPG